MEFFGIEYKFNSIICILYIYIRIKEEDFYIIFPEFAPGTAFVVLLAAAVRPPLALVGDGHRTSQVTDANSGLYAEAYFVRGV